MHLKYIKLVILKILFILELRNVKFSVQIPRLPPPTPAPPPKQNFDPSSKKFSKIFTPSHPTPKLEEVYAM